MAFASEKKIGVIVLDTNMLLAVVQFKIDVFRELRTMFGEVKFVVPTQVVDELDKIALESKKNGKMVGIVRQLMQRNAVELEKIEAENADDALLKMSDYGIIASTDKELRKRIKNNNGKIIYLRKKKILEVG